MNTKINTLFCAIAISLSGLHTQAYAEEIAPADVGEAAEALPANAAIDTPEQPFTGSKINFAPLPVEIVMQPGQKPAVVFTTPCIQIAKMTNNFPPIIAFEYFMLEMIGMVNNSELLPVRLEPVCV
jgi:hypothetical protein